jgi:hypothetical protein
MLKNIRLKICITLTIIAHLYCIALILLKLVEKFLVLIFAVNN